MGEPQEGGGGGGGNSLTWVNHRKVGVGNQPDMGEPQEGVCVGGGNQPDMGEPQKGGGGGGGPA